MNDGVELACVRRRCCTDDGTAAGGQAGRGLSARDGHARATNRLQSAFNFDLIRGRLIDTKAAFDGTRGHHHGDLLRSSRGSRQQVDQGAPRRRLDFLRFFRSLLPSRPTHRIEPHDGAASIAAAAARAAKVEITRSFARTAMATPLSRLGHGHSSSPSHS